MANEKWTPGPWKAEMPLIQSQDGETVSVIKCREPIRERRELLEANAHLIAAAPELYEALNDLLNEAINGTVPLLAQIGKVSEVLRKARGEASK